MSIRTVATLAVAVLLGLLAVFLVRSYVKSARGPAGQVATTATTPVVVAATPVERGAALAPAQLKVVNYPADAVPAGAFRAVTDLTGAAAEKRVAIRSLAANEPILADKVSGPGGRMLLSTTLTEGMRAVSLRSNDIAGVAGFVLPGDRVDILLTREVGGSQVTQVLAENVRVLGVDQTSDEATDKPQVSRAVTIEVTPEQAQKIPLAQAVGQVSLALRNIADQLPLTRRATTVADLGYSGGRPALYRAVARRVRHASPVQEIRVVRGVEASGYRIP
jgi:pilus assembly protein CpaB